MDYRDFRYDGSVHFDIDKCPTSLKVDKSEKRHYRELTAENTASMAELQEKLYARGTEGLVILLQAMDAAGKDSTIKHVMSGVNPQGVEVSSFKNPTKLQLAHDYLWRAVLCLPERGHIGIFNRSYYEDVLVVRVRELWKGYQWPERCCDMDEEEFFARRYRQITDFEEYLYENGYRLCKIFLNVGLDEQKKRFLDRIDDESKHWKFSSSDIAERKLWPDYMKAYEAAIRGTATKHAPWYVIPADQKWVMRYLVSEAIVAALEECEASYPTIDAAEEAALAESRAWLVGGEG